MPSNLRLGRNQTPCGWCRIALALVVFSATPLAAMFMQPTFAPVERLANNVASYLAEHPDDAQAYYNLGRLHFLAYANQSALVPSTGGKDYPHVAGDHLVGGDWLHYERDQESRERALEELSVETVQQLESDERRQAFYDRQVEIYQQLEKENWIPEPVTTETLLRHALASMVAFQQAIALEPDNGLFHLGLASLLETVAGSSTADSTVERGVEEVYKLAATRHYLAAYEAALQSDSQLQTIPITGLQSIVSYEASQGYLRVCSDEESEQRSIMGEHIKRMKGLRRGPITPIVFTLDGRPYEQLDSGASVAFDLDGDGQASRWNWVKRDVGILCWAPTAKSPVDSGLQLFGPFTFNQLWTNGYAPLAALDDNQDGWLNRGELAGIKVWFDRNSNGQVDKAEMVALGSLGIEAISTEHVTDHFGIDHQPSGIRFHDGRCLPSWDWLAQPVE